MSQTFPLVAFCGFSHRRGIGVYCSLLPLFSSSRDRAVAVVVRRVPAMRNGMVAELPVEGNSTPGLLFVFLTADKDCCTGEG